MITLTDDEYKEFMETYLDLMYYAGQDSGIIASELSFEEFLAFDMTKKFKCRGAIYESVEFLEQYITTNTERLGVYKTNVLQEFKKNLKSNFIVLKCLANNAIFIDVNTNEVYAVKALGNPFDELLPYFPVMVQAILLPYNGHIVYDGFVLPSRFSFGPGIRESFNEIYKLAKKRKNIRTEL